jgi:acyl-CoA reductase-like NAD-dependent aldehyde dehydrogenase
MSSERLWIDGRWVASAGNQTIPVINPVSGETIGQSADATAGDVNRAVQAAHEAFTMGPWSQHVRNVWMT